PACPRIKGSHFDHFLLCCREGKPTCADFAYAAAITEFLLLGHLAIKAGVGTKVVWDAAGMRCANIPGLNDWVERPSRPGWY
ncbi:MAG: gfo/Idh/MocA family oxidoreductase, partial [Candidatus Omnitrophica bacterium]|nr:gfo/Idh/MocA family oxidoreductase [Candidatus Omnitrophota bacterium]